WRQSQVQPCSKSKNCAASPQTQAVSPVEAARKLNITCESCVEGVPMSGPVATLLPGVVENATGRGTVGASKKKVLLVDGSRPKRDLRSETMRKLGIEVDCAADIAEARCWWRAGLYDLVLMNVQEASARTDKFCDDVRNATPSQHIMFL